MNHSFCNVLADFESGQSTKAEKNSSSFVLHHSIFFRSGVSKMGCSARRILTVTEIQHFSETWNR